MLFGAVAIVLELALLFVRQKVYATGGFFSLVECTPSIVRFFLEFFVDLLFDDAIELESEDCDIR